MTHPNITRVRAVRVLARFLLAAALSLTPAAPSQAQTVSGGIVRAGTLPPSALASGGTTPSGGTYYRGDGSWQAITGAYTLPIASASVLGGVKIGAGILETGDGTISVTATSSGGFVPATPTAPSLALFAGYYSGMTEYFAAHAEWSAPGVSGEGGGAVQYQVSTDGGATYKGPDGTASTYYVAKGSDFILSHGISSGTITVKAIDLNASGAAAAGVTASASYFAPPLVYSAATPIVLAGSVFSLAASGVTSGTYGYPSAVTVDAYGRLTGLTSGTAPPTYTATAPITLTSGAFGLSLGMGLTTTAGALTRTAMGVAGTYGDATHYPVITTNAYGDVTSVTVQAASGGSGGISYLSTDPSSPATGAVWYNATTHKLKVREASAIYASVFSADTGKPAPGSVVDTSASIASGLILSYPLNEASGSGIADKSATADAGTIYNSSGVATSTGAWAMDSTYTTALSFNGSSVGYAANTHNTATNVETVTVALAFKTIVSSGFQILFYTGQNTTSTNLISSELYLSSGEVVFNCADSTSNSIVTSTATSYADGNWHTVIATRTRHGALTLNVDSATQTTGMDATSNTTSTTSLTILGARPNTGTGPTPVTSLPFTGSLAYLNVWNRVLTSAEITTIQSDPFVMYR